MNRIKNKAFLPPNGSEAKDIIYRPTYHNEEMHDFHSAKQMNSQKKRLRDKFQLTGQSSLNQSKTNTS